MRKFIVLILCLFITLNSAVFAENQDDFWANMDKRIKEREAIKQAQLKKLEPKKKLLIKEIKQLPDSFAKYHYLAFLVGDGSKYDPVERNIINNALLKGCSNLDCFRIAIDEARKEDKKRIEGIQKVIEELKQKEEARQNFNYNNTSLNVEFSDMNRKIDDLEYKLDDIYWKIDDIYWKINDIERKLR